MSDDAVVVTRAMFRAAELLGVRQNVLARVIGEDPSTVSRLKRGMRALAADSKPWEAALLFIRLFRALDALVGSDDEAARGWLHSYNSDLGGVPAELICTLQGLVHVVDYLDGFRARV